MTAGQDDQPPAQDAAEADRLDGYNWDADAAPPPPEYLQLWVEVGEGIDKNQTGTKFAAENRFLLQSFLYVETFSIHFPIVHVIIAAEGSKPAAAKKPLSCIAAGC